MIHLRPLPPRPTRIDYRADPKRRDYIHSILRAELTQDNEHDPPPRPWYIEKD